MLQKDPPRTYLNHVAMIQSKIESQNAPNQNKRVQLPATVFNRSPLRERFGNNFGVKASPSKKATSGLSPLRARREGMLNSGHQNQPSIIRVTSRERDQYSSRGQPKRGYCENHEGKPASYLVTANSQSGQYCQKCAILLASQGFKVSKIESRMLTSGSSPQDIDNPIRRNEISQFVEQIKRTAHMIRNKKAQIQNCLNSSQHFYQQQEQSIMQYYGMLINALEQHRSRTIQSMNMSRAACEQPMQQGMQSMDQALNECQQMKNDIFSSIQAINRAEEKAFRPVMDMYLQKSQKLFHQINNIHAAEIPHEQLSTNDPNDVIRNMIGSIEIGFVGSMTPPVKKKDTNVYFSFENQSKQHYEEQLELDQKDDADAVMTDRPEDLKEQNVRSKTFEYA